MNKNMTRLLAALLATAAPLLVIFPLNAQAAESAGQQASPVRERYTKYEYRIPMRDGRKLFTVVYVPKDSSKNYPFLMVRTPYGSGVAAGGENHYGVDFYPASLGPGKEFEDSGYIFVNQDVRGRFMSEGKWQEMTPHAKPALEAGEGNESQDMYDTVEWLLSHVPGNNGQVGIWGVSYPGFYTSASVINSHPAIKAASPQAPVTNLYMGDDSYHGGALMLAANFDFYAAFNEEANPTSKPSSWSDFDYGTVDAYQYFLKFKSLQNIAAQLSDKQRALFMPNIQHTTYDQFWQQRDIVPHLKNIKAAVLTVGGWFDAEDVQGPFSTYQAIGKQNKTPFNGLVLGPWAHGGWLGADGRRLGNVSFDSATAEYYRKNILLPFFEHYLKQSSVKLPAVVNAFETGTNVWRQYPQWPPAQASNRTLYLEEGGKLSWNEPATEFNTFDEYVSDPNRPVPFVGYPATGVPREYMVSDQRFAATRPDVLVYQSDVLDQDVTVAGPVRPHLFVATSGTDADWVVKLIDVYPADYPEQPEPAVRRQDVPPPAVKMAEYQQLVRGEPLRAKYRHSFERPEAVKPGKVELIDFSMPDILHTFRRGHKIMLQIQSSWFPLIDLNPQKFMDISTARPEDFQKATQRVYRSPGQYSGIVLPILGTPSVNSQQANK